MRVRAYDLELRVDFEGETFEGSVDISFAEADGPIELDAEDLEVGSARVDGAPASVESIPSRKKIRVGNAGRGARTVRLEFRGRARRNAVNGFYVSEFSGGKFLTTMMEPTGCRRLFPCLDVPNQKAVVSLTVTAQRALTVLSNTSAASVADAGAERVWRFRPTPPTALYLFYLGIGPFEIRRGPGAGPVSISAATAPGKAERTAEALAYFAPLLGEYAAYYGRPYPLEKLDAVAVPDLWAGGMENWGAIVFPEIALFLDGATNPSIRRWAVETIAHEIAHQWFGNLVTMESFEDFWLNESFATFVAAKMAARLKLRTDAWAEFMIRTRGSYFSDSLESTHPIRLEATDPETVIQNVDEITYFKGAHVVRMIETFLGETAFREGLARYLERFEFRNARQEDLWAELEAVSRRPVRAVMEAWVNRPGLPVVRVRRSASGLELAQERFRFLPDGAAEAPWPIPIVVAGPDGTQPKVFDRATATFPFSGTGFPQLNPSRGGFFRVWYDADLRREAISAIATLPPVERWALLNDAAAFLVAGSYGLDDYLTMVERAGGASDYPSVMEVTDTLGRLRVVLPARPELHDAALRFLRRQIDRITLAARPGEADTDSVLREHLVEALVEWDAEFARARAAEFDQVDGLDPAVRPGVVLAFAMQGSRASFERLYDRLRAPPSEDAAIPTAVALGQLPDPDLIEALLDRTLGSEVRISHVPYIFFGIAHNPAASGAAWEWLRAHLADLRRRMEGSWDVARILEETIPFLALERPGEVEAFFAGAEIPEAATGIRRGLEVRAIYARFRARFGAPAPVAR
jgi:tricorn protease interacting factor F2/3